MFIGLLEKLLQQLTAISGKLDKLDAVSTQLGAISTQLETVSAQLDKIITIFESPGPSALRVTLEQRREE